MPQTIRIVERITEELDGEGEQIFEDDELTVFRHEHKKWYALISVLERSKITAGQGEVEILNVKLPEDRILELLTQEDYYPAWHMNKKHWLTVILDDSLDDDTVMDLIKTSYILTSGYPMRKTRHWIVPANPRYYDLIDAFHQSKEILWKQSSAVQTGDLVYIYYGSPYSALMFKTKALKVNIPYDYEDVHVKMRYVMKLRLIESYPPDRLPLKKLKDYGITTVRGPRYMPSELFDDLEKHKV